MSIQDPSDYKTGDAVPSNKAMDLNDNAKVFDVFQNSQIPSVKSRLGVDIKTVWQQGQDYISAENARDEKFDSQYIYKNGGNWSDAPSQITNNDKLTYWEYPDNSGDGYAVKGSVTLPIAKPASPINDNNWFLATSASRQYVEAAKALVNNIASKQNSTTWDAGLSVTDSLSIYLNVENGIHRDYLPNPDLLPFTTSSTFAGDVALGRWFSKHVSSESNFITADDMRSASLTLGDVVSVTENSTKRNVGANNFLIADNSLGYNNLSENIQGYELDNGMIASPLNNFRSGQQSLATIYADMRAYAIKHTPWQDGEIGGVAYVSTTTQVNKGSMNIPVTDASHYIVGSLITYQTQTNEYKSAVVRSINGNIIYTCQEVEDVILQGGFVSNFYANSSHPNEYGFRCIVDYAISRGQNSGYLISSDLIDLIPANNSQTSTTEITTNTFGRPPQPYIATTGTGDITRAVKSRTFDSTEGFVECRVFVGADVSATVTIVIFEQNEDGTYSSTLSNSVNVHNGGAMLTTKTCSNLDRKWYAQIFSEVNFWCGQLEVWGCDTLNNLNAGNHVLLGDSWFALPGIAKRLDAVLPSANIINKGVGGNTSVQMINRFETDVTALKPDFVWVMCGTNDTGQGISNKDSNINLKKITDAIRAIGATPIIFSGWAGYNSGNFWDSSCNLYQQDYLRESKKIHDGDFELMINKKLEANGSSLVYISQIRHSNFWMKGFISNQNNANVTIKFGQATSVSAPTYDVKEFPSSTIINSSEKYQVSKIGDANRLHSVQLVNNTASPIDFIANMKVGTHK